MSNLPAPFKFDDEKPVYQEVDISGFMLVLSLLALILGVALIGIFGN